MSAAPTRAGDAPPKAKRRRWPYWLAGLVGALAATYGVLVLVWRHPLPETAAHVARTPAPWY